MAEEVTGNVTARPCDLYLENRGILLGENGYTPDPGQVERTPDGGGIVFYHYTRPERLDQILADGSGLWARLLVVGSKRLVPELTGCHTVQGLLEPLPRWFHQCPYFSDLGGEMVNDYVGGLLLRITVPSDFPGLYVADCAHGFECKHLARRGHTVLGLGYDCRTGHEVSQALVNSYVPIQEYRGGHITPIVEMTRRGEGIVIPRDYISIADVQPRASGKGQA